MNIAIVIPCFKRVKSVIDLCDTLLAADYLGDKVDIVFSIDFSGARDVFDFAQSFKWKFGEKKVIQHSHNIGLRNNILFCGDLTNEYDAVIILEDDLEVMSSFYRYAKQAAVFYDDDEKIAGISIYTYHLEEITMTEFHPCYEGYDGCLIQWASSWGQLWTKKQWMGFRKWYDGKKDISTINIPSRVKAWKNSWKKFYIAYLTDTDKYYVFPFYSHVYNGNKSGGIHSVNTRGEVLTSSPLDLSSKNYSFAKYDKIQYKYDAFFQLQPIILDIEGNKYKCEFDLFGHKEIAKEPYIITVKSCNRNIIIASFDAGMLPVEQNILRHKVGDVFHLIKGTDYENASLIPYFSYRPIRRRIQNWKQLLPLGAESFIMDIKTSLKYHFSRKKK